MNDNVPFDWRVNHSDKYVPFVWRVKYRNNTAPPEKTLEIAHEKARQILGHAVETEAPWPKQAEFIPCQLIALFLRLRERSF